MNKEDVSGLVGLFSGSIANILDFLLIHKGFDYSKTEIAENAGVGYKTLFDNWAKLERYGLVKETRTIGRATLYTINHDSPIVKALRKLQHEIMFYDAEVVTQEQVEKGGCIRTKERKSQSLKETIHAPTGDAPEFIPGVVWLGLKDRYVVSKN